jgi:serine/threonine protein kinase
MTDSAANDRLKSILKAGKLFEGKYRIMRPLGAGSFAIVVHARHEVMERDVALKFLKPKVVESNPEVSERFIREVKIASKLKHPNVVTIFDFGTAQDDLYYMVQEYVAGTTLDTILTNEGAMAPERAIHIAAQVLDCLKEAHALGIIHRDLKPANIMLTSQNGDDNFAKILDFGVAKLLDPEDAKSGGGAARQSTKFIGTPIYMSPEQILGREVQVASDLYSMGLILYEMATGQPPIQADRVAEVVQQHLSDEPLAFPRLHLLPESLAQVILRATSRHPKDRYRSAEAFRRALLGEVWSNDTAEELEPIQEEREPSLWRRPNSPSAGVPTLPATARVASSPGISGAPGMPVSASSPQAHEAQAQDIFSGRNYIDVDDFAEDEFEPAGHFSLDERQPMQAPNKPPSGSGLSRADQAPSGQRRAPLKESATGQPGRPAPAPSPSEQSAKMQRPANMPPSEQSARIQAPAFAQPQHPAPSVEPTSVLPSKLEIDHNVRRNNRKQMQRPSRRSGAKEQSNGAGLSVDGMGNLALYFTALVAFYLQFVIISAVLDGLGGPLRVLFGLSPLVVAIIWTQYNRFGKAMDLHRDWLMPVSARLLGQTAILLVGLALFPARAEIALRHEGVWFLSSFGDSIPWSIIRTPTAWLTTRLADLYAALPWR